MRAKAIIGAVLFLTLVIYGLAHSGNAVDTSNNTPAPLPTYSFTVPTTTTTTLLPLLTFSTPAPLPTDTYQPSPGTYEPGPAPHVPYVPLPHHEDHFHCGIHGCHFHF
ncbi:hypothetical protein [Gandjariella thermophila]|uniref:Uncharacterized protein n=1 Tax=Gandjariella thermophila TaxID=1931992 RepID=A0A4D4J6E5_9PSEU|nr:hypothetical protein [Gandjariella thermophila]GDY29513.1 hypothetical protein GTS_11460 [Gandjariella thermophila]